MGNGPRGAFMFKYIIASTLIIIAAFLFVILNYVGAFKDVKIEMKEAGPFYLYGLQHRGAYHKIIDSLEKTEASISTVKSSCPLTFGLFYDDPENSEEDRLRSFVGCVTPKPVASPENNYETKTMNKRLFLIAHFQGAPSIGPFKVYPKAEEWMQKKGYRQDGPIMEVYKRLPQQGIYTKYYFPITR